MAWLNLEFSLFLQQLLHSVDRSLSAFVLVESPETLDEHYLSEIDSSIRPTENGEIISNTR
jgi:hypothetical protein